MMRPTLIIIMEENNTKTIKIGRNINVKCIISRLRTIGKKLETKITIIDEFQDYLQTDEHV